VPRTEPDYLPTRSGELREAATYAIDPEADHDELFVEQRHRKGLVLEVVHSAHRVPTSP
jgi:hypothetical protein